MLWGIDTQTNVDHARTVYGRVYSRIHDILLTQASHKASLKDPKKKALSLSLIPYGGSFLSATRSGHFGEYRQGTSIRNTPKTTLNSGQGRDQAPHDSTTGPSSQPKDDTSEKVVHESSSTTDSERTESGTEAAAPKGDKEQGEVASSTVTSGVGISVRTEDQAGSDPGKAHEALAGPDPEPMQEDQTGSDSGKVHVSLAGPNPEHTDEEFLATAYPKKILITLFEQSSYDKPNEDDQEKSKVIDESDSTIPDQSHQTVTSTPSVIAPIIDFSSPKPSSQTEHEKEAPAKQNGRSSFQPENTLDPKPRAIIYRDRNDQERLMRLMRNTSIMMDETRLMKKLDHKVKDFYQFRVYNDMAWRLGNGQRMTRGGAKTSSQRSRKDYRSGGSFEVWKALLEKE
ncbi:hypothetical protein Tco_0408450 [Tanacetum coccineum]